MSRKYAREKLDAIQMEYGIVYTNFGEVDQARVGPTRGGVTFEAVKELRDIEYDGRIGKTKLQVIDAIDAVAKVNNLAVSREDVKLAMPWLTETGIDPNFVQEATEASIGVIPDAKYFKNVTIFGKQVGGGFKKVTLYNAMNEADFSMALAQKAEAEISLEIYAHWEVDEDDVSNVDKLYTIEEVPSIA